MLVISGSASCESSSVLVLSQGVNLKYTKLICTAPVPSVLLSKPRPRCNMIVVGNTARNLCMKECSQWAFIFRETLKGGTGYEWLFAISIPLILINIYAS
uniref:7TM_GPCR_Srx domain-containing protein n=1 Tax=Steinernema glaseri TaxID=37863 RepID=A0A1I7ZJH9_9BILA